MEKPKQRIRHIFLFQCQLNKSVAEAKRNICTTIGPKAVSTNTAEMWYKRFRLGDYSLQDKSRSGAPSNINLNSLKSLIESYPNLSTRQVASTLGCSNSTVRYNFCKLELVSKLGALIPHELNQNQLKSRVEVGQRLQVLRRTDAWLEKIIRCDEKWVCYSNNVRKRQWVKHAGQARSTPKPPLHPKKRMLCVWWGTRGVVHWE